MTRGDRPAIALTIAGSDSSGCAGVQADLRTFAAHDVHGASVITALTAQHVAGVDAIGLTEPDLIRAQLSAVLDRLPVRAMKTGMLGAKPQMEAVWEALERHPNVPLVVDPVLHATSGDPLTSLASAASLRETWLPRITLLTPNLDEARTLADVSERADEAEVREAIFAICRGKCAVVLTGGHHQDPGRCSDHVQLANGVRFMVDGPRIETRSSRGTGCTFSAAITANLARGFTLDAAIRSAKRYITEALRHARPLVAAGGPVAQLWAQQTTSTGDA